MNGRATAEIHGPPAEAEVTYAADFMRWYADLAPQISGRYEGERG
jgi:acyl-CoA reductase-like NAD-dependent aldehyde dehydrogenase